MRVILAIAAFVVVLAVGNEKAACCRSGTERFDNGKAPVGELNSRNRVQWVDLGETRHSGKVVTAYAVWATEALEWLRSNEIEIEWPPRSGRTMSIPEVDRGEWMSLERARERLVKGQRVFLDRLSAAACP